MEYKFDQLKVETLEGTLNIGLNPSDLQGIEDFSVPKVINGSTDIDQMKECLCLLRLKVPPTNILMQIFSPLWLTHVSNYNFKLMKLIMILFFKILKNSFQSELSII